ncbi:MAG: hypothetical protein JRE71_03210 [Deltaproteobacteria bacterium]|nr:hypothetical protein [Deltaproteobacteria bacterium]
MPGGDSRRAQPLIDRAAERGVDLLSIEEPLRAAIESPGFSKRSFFHVRSVSGNPEQVGHMSAEGNRFVAEAISKRLAGKI